MEQFQAAWQKVMTGAVTASVGGASMRENSGQRNRRRRDPADSGERLQPERQGPGFRGERPCSPASRAPPPHISDALRDNINPCRKTCRLRQARGAFCKTFHPRSHACRRGTPGSTARTSSKSNDVPPSGLRGARPRSRGKFLGTALYSSSSQIAIRMISHGSVADLPALVAERIRAAIAYRKESCREYRCLPHRLQRSRFSARPHRRSL
jgi:hypothetical protein